jgi:hypothetical protein
MATDRSTKQLHNKIEGFLKLDKEKLINRPNLGEMNFEEGRRDFDRLFGLVGQLAVMPVELLPDDIVTQTSSGIDSTVEGLKRIEAFTLKSNNPTSERNTHLTNLQQQTDHLFKIVGPWIPFLAYQRGDVERNIQSLTSAIKSAEKMVEDGKTRAEKAGKEIEEIIAKAREASAAAGAAVFTKDFEATAATLEEDAAFWLKVTASAAGTTLALSVVLWLFPQRGLDQGELVQRLSSKLVMLVVLISGTIWCGRNYKALKHLATINRHRALSIRTLQAFAAAAADVQAKDAVLLEATRAVFGNVPTGYIEGGSSDGDLKIVEVARNLLPKPPSGG